MTAQKINRPGNQKRPSNEPLSQDPSSPKGRQNRQNQEGKKNENRPVTFDEGKWQTGNRQRNLSQKKSGEE